MSASIQAVHEAIAIARKLRDAPNNGDAARHGVDVAAHVLDVTRSGAASAGAAKARHARAGAPLVVRVVLLALVLMFTTFFSEKTDAAYVGVCSNNPGGGVACSSITWHEENSRPSSGYFIGWTTQFQYYDSATHVQSFTAVKCPDQSCGSSWAVLTGSAYWTSGYSPPAITSTVICTPSGRTVSPCPAGYAPKEITVQSSEQPDPYQNTFDSMPLQEMLYALCIGIAGLLGFSVGARLV